MIHNATRLIINALEERDLHFTVTEAEKDGKEVSFVEANIPIKEGPLVYCGFISTDEDSDVAVRINGIFNDVPEHKWDAMRRACNKINDKCRFVKMVLDEDDGDVSLQIDMPPYLPDEVIGEVALMYFAACAKCLNDNFYLLAEAMYSNGGVNNHAPAKPSLSEMFKVLSALKREPIVLENQDSEELDF